MLEWLGKGDERVGEEGRSRAAEGVTGASTPAGLRERRSLSAARSLEMNNLPRAWPFQGPLHIRLFLGPLV